MLHPNKIAWVLKKAGFKAGKEGAGRRALRGGWETIRPNKDGFSCHAPVWAKGEYVYVRAIRDVRNSKWDEQSAFLDWKAALERAGYKVEVRRVEWLGHISITDLKVMEG